MLQDFYALERMTLQQTRPVRLVFMHAYLGGNYEIMASHASYNELCFVEHVLDETEEKSWNNWVAAWVNGF